MIVRPKPARALLPSLLLVVGAALPAGTTAQTSPPPAETSWLSASMSEARRSPFHSPASVSGPAFLGSVPSRRPVNEGFQLADSTNDPSFLKVFLPTLAATAAADYVLFLTLANLIDTACDLRCDLRIAAAVATVLLAPPAAANLAGGLFPSALLGSALGVGVSLVILEAEDNNAIVVPFVQSGLTTWLSLVGQ